MNIKELAVQAGLLRNSGLWDIWNSDNLEKFVALVIAHEREECATIVDHILKEGGGTYGDAIRARSKE
jgi:hypothetical protein